MFVSYHTSHQKWESRDLGSYLRISVLWPWSFILSEYLLLSVQFTRKKDKSMVRVSTHLPQDSSSVRSSHIRGLTTTSDSRFRGSILFPGLHRHLHSHVHSLMQTYMCTWGCTRKRVHTHTHTELKIK